MTLYSPLKSRIKDYLKQLKMKIPRYGNPKEATFPPDSEIDSEKALKFFISHPLKLVDRFKKKLNVDDSFYRMAKYVLAADAKSLFLYGCARQVNKACISLIHKEGLIKGGPDNAGEPSTSERELIGRELIETFYDEQNLWIRKLIEILLSLINFQATNTNEAYRIFLSAENLDLFLGKQKEFRDFYGFTSGNVKSSIQSFVSRIEEDLTTLGVKNIWFLDNKKMKSRTPSVFTSILSRYKQALPLATDEEKIAIGATYHRVFSMVSLSAHASIGSLPQEIRFKSLNSNVGHISILSQHILNRANNLMEFEEPESIEKLLAKGSIAPSLIKQLEKKFEVGDLVLAFNDLAEILEVRQSQFGYTSHRVKFLRKPPIPETPEDWLPSGDIVRLVAKTNIRELFSKSSDKIPHHLKDELIMNRSDEQLYESTKKIFIDLDGRGLLIPLFFGKQK